MRISAANVVQVITVQYLASFGALEAQSAVCHIELQCNCAMQCAVVCDAAGDLHNVLSVVYAV